ncbi:MAG: alpha/beta hydrolase fold domain-containing protein [Roseibacillus sp.]
MKWIVLALVGTGFSSGQVPFERLDKNGDGLIQKEELPAGLRKNFERVDSDGSGGISKEEHEAVTRRRGGPHEIEGVTVIRDVDYVGEGNQRQMMDFYLPENEEDLPVILWVHGGAWKSGNRGGINRVKSFLEDGRYAVVSIGYRLTDEAQWPAQIHDCKAAVRFVRANGWKYGLDPERIAVVGSSAGGHLVAMLGLTGGDAELEGELGLHVGTSSKVSCVVDFFGSKDHTVMDEQGSRMDHGSASSPEGLLVGGAIAENLEKARESSPIYHVSKGDAPMLIFHGTKDPLVPYQQSVDFEKAFEAEGGDVTLVTIEGGGHGKGFPAEVEKLFGDFLENACYGGEHEIIDHTLKAIR